MSYHTRHDIIIKYSLINYGTTSFLGRIQESGHPLNLKKLDFSEDFNSKHILGEDAPRTLYRGLVPLAVLFSNPLV